MAKVLELELQHQSFHWIFRVHLLCNVLVWSPCCPSNSQESSPAPQFKSISSLVLSLLWTSLVAQMVDSTSTAADIGSIPGLARSPGEGKGNPLQKSSLKNSMDRGAWLAAIHGSKRVGHNCMTITFTDFLMIHLLYLYMTTGKTIALTIRLFVSKVMFLFFNTLSSFVTAFFPRSKIILISWLQSLSAVILKPKKT